MVSVLMDSVLFTDYGEFTVLQGRESFDGNAERFFADQINGWVGAGVPGVIHVVMARRSGGSGIRIELWENEPPPGNWEDVVEVSATFQPGEPIGWQTWAGDSAGTILIPPRSYRVRVSAHGRDAGRGDEFADGVVDRYVMQFWPAANAPDEVIKTTSADAKYWHSEWGSRRS
jgi:hypothetical protein